MTEYHFEVDFLTVLEFISTPSRGNMGSIFVTFVLTGNHLV